MKESSDELEALIAGCKKNDRKCQRAIYEMLYGQMLGACMRYCSNKDEAEDVLQDGFIKVFEKIRLYKDDGIFEGWVRRIIVNTAIDFIRKRKKEFLTDDTSIYHEGVEDEPIVKDEGIYKGLAVNDVVEAMQELSPMYRTVFNLYVMEGLTHKEISEELDISVGTSKSNLSKARANLKKVLMRKIERNE